MTSSSLESRAQAIRPALPSPERASRPSARPPFVEGVEVGILTRGKATLGEVLVSLLLQEAVRVRIRVVDTSAYPVINRDDVRFALRLAAHRGIECNYDFAGPSERAFSEGRGRLIGALKGRHLCLVDDDVVMPSGALARLLATAQLSGVYGYISPTCKGSPNVSGNWGGRPACTPGSLLYQDDIVRLALLEYYRTTVDVLDQSTAGGKVWEQAFLTSLFDALGRTCARQDDTVIYHLDYGEGPRWIDEERTVIARSEKLAIKLAERARSGDLLATPPPRPPTVRPPPRPELVRLSNSPLTRLLRALRLGH